MAVGVLAFALISGCDRGPDEAQQARQLVAAVTDLGEDDAPDKRHARLLALKRMPLAAPELAQIRDRCVEAHTALMLAEAAQTMARVQLQKAQPDDGGALSPEATAEVSRAIRRSNSQLEVATGAFEACREATRELAIKHR